MSPTPNMKSSGSAEAASGQDRISSIFNCSECIIPTPTSVLTTLGASVPSLEFPTSLSAVVENRAEGILSAYTTPFSNYMGQYYSAICAGAMLGTAVTTGVLVGVAAAAGLVFGTQELLSLPRNLVKIFARLKRGEVRKRGEHYTSAADAVHGDDSSSPWLERRDMPQVVGIADNHSSRISDRRGQEEMEICVSGGPPRGQHSGEREALRDENSSSGAKVACMGDFVVFNGNSLPVRGETISCEDQCRECLDDVCITLGRHSLGWQHVRKLTIYLVVGKCNVSIFKAVLNEYPFPGRSAIATYLFVQQLEEEHTIVQVEVIASLR